MLTLAGCSCGEVTALPDAFRAPDAPIASDAFTSVDASPGADAPELDALPASDAFSANDAFVPSDAPLARDAGADATTTLDAASSCPRVVADRFAGVCDGRGRAICAMWAAESSGGAPASAVCLGPEGLCARASECTGSTLNTCRCGSEPACGANEVCISGFAGYSCTCAP